MSRMHLLGLLLVASTGCNSRDLSTSTFRELPHVDFDGDHDELMRQVERIQAEQTEILRYLMKNYGLREVFVEGLTDEAIFKAKIDGLREIAAKIGEAKSLGAYVTEVEREHRKTSSRSVPSAG